MIPRPAAGTHPPQGMIKIPANLFTPKPKRGPDAASLSLLIQWLALRPWAVPVVGVPDGGLDLIKTAKLLIISHIKDGDMRAELARSADINLDLLRTLADPELLSFSKPGAKGGTAAPAWVIVMLFEHFRLEPYNTNYAEGKLDFKSMHNVFAARRPRQSLPDTRNFADFQEGLIEHANAHRCTERLEDELFWDSELLYFVCTCLLDKNAVEVLKTDHFGYLQTKLPDALMVQRKGAGTYAGAIYDYLKARNPYIEIRRMRTEEWQNDFKSRLDPVQEAWIVLLRRMRSTTLPAIFQAMPPPVPPREETPQGPDVPARDTDAEGDTPQGQGGSATTTSDQPTANGGGDAATVEARISKQIGAACGAGVCLVHDGGHSLCDPCPSACLERRFGPAPLRTRGESDALASNNFALRHALLHVGRESGARALIAASLLPNDQQLAQQLSGSARVPAMKPASAADWASTLRLYDQMPRAVAARIDGVDDFADAVGISSMPAHERVKAYIGTYVGAPNGLSTAQQQKAAAYKKQNPTLTARAIQALMHFAGSDAQ